MTLGADHGAGAEGGGGAQDGADIVRVRYLVEQDHGSVGAIGEIVTHLIYVGRQQRLGQDGEALMHRSGRKLAGEDLAVDGFQVWRALWTAAGLLKQGNMLRCGFGGGEQAVEAP